MASERETVFFECLWTWLRDQDGTEDGRALNGVYPWRFSKAGYTVLGCSMRWRGQGVCLIGDPDFDCVSVKAVTMAAVDAAQFDIRGPGR